MKYKFSEPLIEGLIKERPNRFIMFVEINGKKERCHCPSTGRIGNIIFKDIPCLVSKSDNPNRSTKYTVEAISLDSSKKKSKKWIGINQVKMNKYVEYFFKTNQFKKIIKNSENVKRERKLGNSRIDFQIDKIFVEVKTLLIYIPSRFDKLKGKRPESNPDNFLRLIKHFNDLGKEAKKKDSRAILLLCYQYDAEKFKRPKTNSKNLKIKREAKKAEESGLENWQANFKITKTGIELINYFNLKLF